MMAIYFGINPPFIGGAEKVLSRQEDLKLIKNDLLQLILTSPGERVHRPEFGTPIRDTVFDPSDRISYDILANEIAEEIINSEPRVFNPQVTVQPIDDGQVIKVKVVANVTFSPNTILELEQEISI